MRGRGGVGALRRPYLISECASAETRQQAHQAAGARGEQGGRVKAAGGALAGLAERRVGRDQIGHRADLEPLRDRQRPGLDQLAGRRRRGSRRRGCARCGSVTILTSPAVSRSVWARSFSAKDQRSTRDPVAVRVARRRLAQPDLGQLGIGVGDPGQRPVIDPRRQPEQRVADDDPGVVERDMGELRAAGGVADGKDAAVGRAQPRVDDDAVRGRRRSRRRRDRARRDSAAGRRRPADAIRRSRSPLASDDGDPVAGALDRRRPRPRAAARCPRRASRAASSATSSGSSRGSSGPASITVTAAPSRRCACASSMPIGPPPITIRCAGQRPVGEHRLVGEERHAVEARDRRHDRRRAGGDDKPPRPDRRARRRATVRRVDEARFGAEHAHAEALEALRRIVRARGAR